MHDFRFALSPINPFRFALHRPASFAVEGSGAFGVKGLTPNAGHDDTDPDWQPM